MLAILQLIFSDFWHFAGAFLILHLFCQTLLKIVYVIVSVIWGWSQEDDDDDDRRDVQPITV